MKPALLLMVLLVIFSSSCQKGYYDSVESTYDPDVQKFIDSSGISPISQKDALNNFVVQLKATSLWSKFMAIYPMIGGTEQSVKWNLKDPRNIDAAFRLTMHGSPVCSEMGVLFLNSIDYADTHLYDSLLAFNDNSISYYSITQNSVDGYDMGCVDNAAPYNELAIYHSSDASNWFGYYSFGYSPATTTGLFMLSSTVNDVKRYDNGIITSSKGSSPVSRYCDKPILIGTVAAAYSGGHRQCVLATIGKGFTDEEVNLFSNIARSFETSLGR